MLRSFRSEWTKIRRRSILIGGALMPIFALIFIPLAINRASNTPHGFGARFGPQELTILVLQTNKGLTTLISFGAALTSVIALAVVAAATAVEYSHGTLRNLLVRQPRRLELIGGKYIALISYVLIAATVAFIVGVLIAFPVASGRGIDTSAWTSSSGLSNLFSLYGNVMFAVWAYGTLGFLSALVFRSAAAAVAVPLVYIVVLENLIAGVWTDAHDWLFGKLIGGVLNAESILKTDTSVASFSRGLWLGLAYVVIFAVIGGLLFRFRDVTS